jgi:hypothetical protein
MSDSPRTDRAQFAAIPDAGRGSRFVVEADFARQLERELSDIRVLRQKQTDRAVEAAKMFSAKYVECESLKKELAEARREHEFACMLVAKMHAAATDRPGDGPIRGVVEDVEDVRRNAERYQAWRAWRVLDTTAYSDAVVGATVEAALAEIQRATHEAGIDAAIDAAMKGKQ